MFGFEFWRRVEEAEVVEVDMAPAGAGVIDDADEDFFAEVLREIGDDGPHLFGAASAGFEDNFIRIGADEFDAERSAGTAADEKGGIRMRRLRMVRT